MSETSDRIKALATKYNRSEEMLAKRVSELLFDGLNVPAALKILEEDLSRLPGFKTIAPQAGHILLPVEETKFEEFATGVHAVTIVGIEEDQQETDELDSGGMPVMRKYLRIVFEDKDKKHMNGFCSEKVGTRSKLYGWITHVTGQEPVVGTSFDVMSLVGKKCRVYVQDARKKDGTLYRKIGDVLPAEG